MLVKLAENDIGSFIPAPVYSTVKSIGIDVPGVTLEGIVFVIQTTTLSFDEFAQGRELPIPDAITRAKSANANTLRFLDIIFCVVT